MAVKNGSAEHDIYLLWKPNRVEKWDLEQVLRKQKIALFVRGVISLQDACATLRTQRILRISKDQFGLVERTIVFLGGPSFGALLTATLSLSSAYQTDWKSRKSFTGKFRLM